jgi:tetratricopeptide (TPR) repeat protein
LLAAAEEKGATILPVIIRPCVFTSTDLNQFQAVNDPAEPLSKISKYRREVEWTKIAKLVEEALNAQEKGKISSDATQSRRDAKTPTSSEQSTNAEYELPLTMNLSTRVEPRKTKEDYRKEGIQHYEAKRYKKAVATYNNALKLDPTDPYIYGRRAETYLALKENERALQDLNRAFELDPKSATPWAYALRGDVYYSMKQFQNALDDFQHALDLDPTYTWVKRRRNETLEKLKKQGE